MTATEAERWQRVRELFRGALELVPGKRCAFLDRECAGDDELRSDVDLLLDSLDRAGDFLEEPAALAPETLVEDPYAGLEVGPYRLEQRLGRGGMGVVYLAHRIDQEFQQRVAVKLLPPGESSDEMVRRFRAERQILAALGHPNIAQLHDGGTTPGGLPYLVMEHVEGIAIDEYCDAHALSTRQRLELFCEVCSAVHFAHQNLVVHRDLKPSNILVTEGGTPKLLDFGIAKLLRPELAGDRTATARRRMTPEYASPEQVTGTPVSTASDVYSLGALLYKLLTGRLPHRLKTGSPAELVKAICDQEPEKASVAIDQAVEVPGPSGARVTLTPESVSETRDGEPNRLRRRLAGDVDNIVLMALRKEPQRRYASAQQLARDIRDHLAGRPILARENTLPYRLGKFAGRNRWAVAATAALFLACLAFALLTALQKRQVERERDRAEQVTDFLIDIFEVSDPYAESPQVAGREVTAREILDAGARRLESSLVDQPRLRASLTGTIGTIYLRLGQFEDSRKHLDAALEIRRRLYGGGHPEVAANLADLAHLALEEGSHGEANRLLLQALEIQRRELGEDHGSVADTLALLGALRIADGTLDAAEPILEDALRRRRRSGDPAKIAKSLNDLAVLRESEGRYLQAQELYQEALEIRQSLYRRSHPDVAESINNLGTNLFYQGDYHGALPRYQESLELYQRLFGDQHPYVAISLTNLATLRHMMGDLEAAEPRYREALALGARLLGERHPSLATTRSNFANLLMQRGELAEAERLHRRVLEVRRELLGTEHPHVAISLDQLGAVLHLRGEFNIAQAMLEESLEMRRRLLGEEHAEFASSLRNLALLHADRGDAARAEPMARRSMEILRLALSPEDWRTYRAQSVLGACLTRLGRYDEAEGLLRESYEALLSQRGEDARETRETRERLIELYQRSGRPEHLLARELDPASSTSRTIG